MKFLNKVTAIVLYSFACCNISSLSSASNISSCSCDFNALNMEIQSYINNDENSDNISSNKSINASHNDILMIEYLTSKYWRPDKMKYNNYNLLSNINQNNNIFPIWGYNINGTFYYPIQNNDYNLPIHFYNPNQIPTVFHNANQTKKNNACNSLDNFYLAFEYVINKIGDTNISIFDKLHTIIVYYGLLIDISNYYSSKKHFNKNSIPNSFRNISKKFIEKSNYFYKRINENKNIDFKEKHKGQLVKLSELLNNKCDFLK